MTNESVDSIENFLKYGLESSRDTIANINKIEKYKSRLLDGSEEAKSLTYVISMLTKSYESAINELNSFLDLSFNSPAELNESENFLLSAKLGFEGSKLKAARPYSHIIGQNYVNFLANWKESKLDKTQAIEFDKIFREKLMDDSRFSGQIENIGDFLTDAATQIYDLLIANRVTEAIVSHQDFSQVLKPQLKKLSEEWNKLKKLEQDFQSVTLSQK